jgi:pimeloyl-ACP methyl ester carboxylesterase
MPVRDEVGALGRAAGDAADRLATTPAQGVHAAIADRIFGRLGAAALPARALHDGVSTAVYAGVRTGVAVGARAGAVVAKARGTDPEIVSRTRRGTKLQAIVNGLIGHELALESDPLAVNMGLWRDGEPITTATAAPADPTGAIAVFVHGLFESERSWMTAAGDGYGDMLKNDSGWTPLFVRYNTGLPIIENGRKLSWLLDEIVASWPVEVERIALVGHSMGGLVNRVAGRMAEDEESGWRDHLTHVACLGTPHQGAPLEQFVHRTAGLLSRVPEIAPIGAILDQRSAGIRDLRRGVDAGPLLDDVHHFFLGATITADPKHPIGLVLGDLLVREASAAGPCDVEIHVDDRVHLGGLNHFHLLNHARVYEHLQRFLSRASARRGPRELAAAPPSVAGTPPAR